MRPGSAGLAVVVVLSAALAGCSVETTTAHPYKPASVGAATADGVKPVTFTDEGARRIGLTTSTVTTVGGRTIVDYAALIYDSKGASWVYTVADPLTFLRVKVEVAEVERAQVYLVAGPLPGTSVVTVGSAQLYGEELGISGKH
jgi:hypothetical protein